MKKEEATVFVELQESIKRSIILDRVKCHKENKAGRYETRSSEDVIPPDSLGRPDM